MSKGKILVIGLVTIVGGFFVGRLTRDKIQEERSSAATAGITNGVERRKVAAEGPSKGSPNALVTVVVFSEFQCPFCSKVVPTLDRLIKEYPDQVRVVFRHFPLAFHHEAPLASQAAMAAEAQGKFWEMHDKLFANQQNLKRPDLEKYAQELSLDMGQFKAALDKETFKSRVDKDMTAGSQIGVRGTPASFINGRPLEGAYPYDDFKKIVDEEIATAKKLIAKGVAADKVYGALMAQAGAAKPPEPKAPGGGRPNVGNEVYKVEIGSAPTKGGKEPKVTIIEFSEFQCPFCSRVTPTLQKIHETYGDDVQVAFKHLPLPFHNNARVAALAAIAAQKQGKFWQMHDKLFANQQTLDRPNLEKYAQELGLDMGKFKAALDGEEGKGTIEADENQAKNFGATGTPTFFINGRKFRGAQPFENFKMVIDEEMKKADDKLKAGTPRAGLYAAIIKDGLAKAAALPPQGQPGEPEPGVAYRVDASGAPSKGPKDALVTIVQFSDFECPFCGRVEPTIDQLLEDYKGKLRVVWRDLPLPFHANAIPAAIAARVAGEQGKFWEMHKKLFVDQKALDRASLERYAQELGLNVNKLKAAFDSDKYKKAVDADAAMGAKVGARGTPAFFINGVSISGAQPLERFKAIIDEQLKKAEALVAKGTPKSKVYETIMKDAKAEVVAAPPRGQQAEAGPEADEKVWKVEPGNDAPSRGPKNAAITMVVFSDFECPFCSRVEPTISQMEKDYPGKIRVVWKNYPLEFHKNAKPAAQAALAAGEQGKFWQMHDKLFENQKALDGASLEKYAQELGLDLGKFKAAMASPKFAAQIDAEMKEAAAVEVTGTPATFINGRKISGAYPPDTFKKIIDQELAKVGGKGAKKKLAIN